MIGVNPALDQGKHIHLNTSGPIEQASFEQGVHLLNLGFRAPSISNGDDEPIASNVGLG